MENNERPRKILKQWTDSRSDNQQVPYSTKKRLERKFRKIALNHEREENDVYMAVNRNEFNIHVQDEYQGYEEGPELIESNILNDLSAKDEEEGNNSEDHLSNTENNEDMYFSDDNNNSFEEIDYESDSSNVSNDNDNNVERDSVLFDLDFLSQPVCNHSQVTVGEVIFLIETFASSEGLTDKSLDYILKIIGFILGRNNLPSSLYHYKKIFSRVLYAINYYLCCLKCENVIVKAKRSEMSEELIECEVCKSKRNKNLTKGIYYVIFDLKRQFRICLEDEEVCNALSNNEGNRAERGGDIQDIFDGELYKNLKANEGVMSNLENLSVHLSWNGASWFKSNVKSGWPFQFSLNRN